MELRCDCGNDGTHRGDGFIELRKQAFLVRPDGSRIQAEPERDEVVGYYCIKCQKQLSAE